MNTGRYQLIVKNADGSKDLFATSGTLETQAHLDAWWQAQSARRQLQQGQEWIMPHESHPEFMANAAPAQPPVDTPNPQGAVAAVDANQAKPEGGGVNLGEQVTNTAAVLKYERLQSKKRQRKEFDEKQMITNFIRDLALQKGAEKPAAV